MRASVPGLLGRVGYPSRGPDGRRVRARGWASAGADALSCRSTGSPALEDRPGPVGLRRPMPAPVRSARPRVRPRRRVALQASVRWLGAAPVSDATGPAWAWRRSRGSWAQCGRNGRPIVLEPSRGILPGFPHRLGSVYAVSGGPRPTSSRSNPHPCRILRLRRSVRGPAHRPSHQNGSHSRRRGQASSGELSSSTPWIGGSASGLPYMLGCVGLCPTPYRRGESGVLNPNRQSCSVDVNRKIPKRQAVSLKRLAVAFIGASPFVWALTGYFTGRGYRAVQGFPRDERRTLQADWAKSGRLGNPGPFPGVLFLLISY